MKKWLGCGCLILLASGIVIPVAIIFGGAGGIVGWLSSLFSPGNNPPEAQPAVPPCLCTPTPVVTATPLPSATLLPTWPLPPTPNPGDPPPPPVIPTDLPAADATATWTEYQSQQQEYEAHATQVAAQWQATVTAAYATQTALVPTPTPPPPTPIGGGPYGWPIDPYCRGYDGCAADEQGIRIITQDYGCTWVEEWPCLWCENAAHAADHRWQANGNRAGQNWHYYHEGVDMDTGLDEPLWATLDGVIIHAGVGSKGISGGCGVYVVVQDPSGVYSAMWCHLNRLGDAVDIQSGQSLGRSWAAGDRIRPYDSLGRHIVIGYSGSTGYSTGPHLHYQLTKRGRTGTQDIDPIPYIQRTRPTDPLPSDDPPYGYAPIGIAMSKAT